MLGPQAIEPSSTVENKHHIATKHSVLSVQIDPNYVDARTQPTAFKRYPHFFRRFPLNPDHSLHQFLSITSAITEKKQYRDGSTHLLRVQPSAGALYPTELYVQLRGVKGMIDGIYHFEPSKNALTLIYELIDDGIEGYLQDRRPIKGCILLVSCVYFRSSWKYKARSLRYCFLDSGHHLGAVEAATYVSDYSYQLLFDFSSIALNDDLGFGTQEFITGMVIVGEAKDRLNQKPIRQLRSPLPFVPATDYFEPNPFIEKSYKELFSSREIEAAPVPQVSSSHNLRQSLLKPIFAFEPTQWGQAIQRRRSARRFYPIPVSYTAFTAICSVLQQPIPYQHSQVLEIYAVVHHVEGMQPGLYLDPLDQQAACLKAGDFQAQTGHLCLDQAIARDSAFVFFITSRYPHYGIALQLAGLIGQRLYLAATVLNLGCSGIGAFYDDDAQAFLKTDNSVLYAIAIGQRTNSTCAAD